MAFARLHTYVYGYIHPCMHACIHSSTADGMHTCIHSVLPMMLLAGIHVHTSIDACIHALCLSLRMAPSACINACMDVSMPKCRQASMHASTLPTVACTHAYIHPCFAHAYICLCMHSTYAHTDTHACMHAFNVHPYRHPCMHAFNVHPYRHPCMHAFSTNPHRHPYMHSAYTHTDIHIDMHAFNANSCGHP
jgi:hypothetical protein